jgi:hypothetical protein
MKKKFYVVCNLLLSSLITLLGFGSCKTHKTVVKEDPVIYIDESVPPPPPDSIVKPPQTEPTPVLYGPPPTDRVRLYGAPPVERIEMKDKE